MFFDILTHQYKLNRTHYASSTKYPHPVRNSGKKIIIDWWGITF